MTQFKDLLVFGDMRVLATVYAKKFVGEFEGNIKGNADTATNATNDANGKNIASTYITSITGDGTSDEVTFTFGDGSTKTFKTKDTKVDIADNLTTAKADTALSANQGVVIDGRVSALETAATVGTF